MIVEDLWWRWVDRLEDRGWGARAMVRPPAGDEVIAAAAEVVGGFPEDGGGNHLMVDLDPPPGGTVGQVLVAGPDEDERRVLAPGVGAYLAALLDADLDPPDADQLADGVAWWDAPGLR